MTCHAFEQNSARERSLFADPSAWNALPADIRDEICNSYLQEEIENFLFLPGV